MLLALVFDPLGWPIGCTHADSSETGLELSFRASTPSDALPFGAGQHVLGRHRQNIWNGVLTPTAASGDWEDELHADRVDLEVTRDADGPAQVATRQRLAERCALPVAGIGQHAAKTDTARDQAINFGKRDLRLRSCSPVWDRNAGSPQTCRVVRPALRQEEA